MLRAAYSAPSTFIAELERSAKKSLDAVFSIAMFVLMPTTLPISRMSTVDKLLAMEQLWVSLTAEKKPLRMPAWHKTALLETEARVQSGKEEFIDWVEAKKSLRRRAK
jgi:hypothetical protein